MAAESKRIRRLLREFAAVAEEAELRRALLPLADAFKRWERGELDSFALKELIHQFHQGPARDIYLRNDRSRLEPSVARAIVSSVVDRAAVPAEVLDNLAGLIEFFQAEQAGS